MTTLWKHWYVGIVVLAAQVFVFLPDSLQGRYGQFLGVLILPMFYIAWDESRMMKEDFRRSEEAFQKKLNREHDAD